MRIIIGLGNPEKRYDGGRHNVGFAVLDHFAKENDLKFKNKSRFQANIAEGDDFLLVKPTTYYNLVGISARALADFYKVPLKSILIIHDELDIPFGVIRTRLGGSHAGNNGLKSLETHLGLTTARLRVGTYTEDYQKMDTTDFVLAKFSEKERESLPKIMKKAADLIDDFLNDKFEVTTHK